MEKSQFVADLSDGSVADSLFMVKDVGKKSFNSKEGSFMQLQLMDKTGTITAICWEPELLDFEVLPGNVVKVRGIVRDHKSFGHQMIFKPESVSLISEYNLSDFLKKTAKDIEEMYSFILLQAGEISNTYLKQLVLGFFQDNEFAKKFKIAPSAKFYHHNFVGGLLEHTVNVVKFCQALLAQYPMDKDILLAGAILHDIGKLQEYGQNPVIEITDRGGLTGHLVIGHEMINEAIAKMDGFPPVLKLKLEHIMLSHHLKPEYGAAQKPKFMEALAIAHADYLDAKIQSFKQSLEEAGQIDSENSANWRMNKNLGYYAYNK